MKKLLTLTAGALGIGACLGGGPAAAQMSPGGDMRAPRLQPQTGGDRPLPPAVPGAGQQNLQTSQSVKKPNTGDPTTDLFSAINGNDYGQAQDAISRGADLNAKNALGETPIDLSVALNRNTITFLLLSARNDSGAPAAGPPAVAAVTPRHRLPAKTRAEPARLVAKPPAPMTGSAAPDPNAGFLGFGH